MIHLALVIVAIWVILIAGMLLLSAGFSGFQVNKGCGCVTLFIAGLIAVAVLVYAFG